MSSQTRKASEEFAWCLGTETHQMIDGKVPTSHKHAVKTQTNSPSLTALQTFLYLTNSVTARNTSQHYQ